MGHMQWNYAYETLALCTPMAFDCGRLCGARCCENEAGILDATNATNATSTTDSGMYLFPGEQERFPGADWYTVQTVLPPVSLEAGSCKDPPKPVLADMLVCTGSCPRAERPFACRIFPLTPYIPRNGGLVVRMDPRGHEICPIHKSSELLPAFVQAVQAACEAVAQLPDTYAFMWHLSRMLDDVYGLHWT